MRTVTIEGRTFGSPPVTDEFGNRWVLERLDGWDNGGASVRRQSTERPRSHGTFGERGWRGGRTVAVIGHVLAASRSSAAGVVASLNSLLADGQDGSLSVVDVDQPNMGAEVGLADEPTIRWSGRDYVGVLLEFFAADPLRYGDPSSQYTGFPERTGGLRWPMFSDGAGNDVGATDWGEVGSSGRAGVSNPGTAASWPQFQVEGPVPAEGFEIVTVGSGARLRFTGAVPAGSSLVIDTATGLVLVDGRYDRVLTVSEPEPVPPGASAEYQFVNLGERTDAVLTASVRPAFW